MAYDIVTVGPVFVEIMRKELEKPLDTPADFTGPYPSADSAIMLNAAAKLGAKTAFVGVVGDDGFGRCCINRLNESGVDTSMIKKRSDIATGCAFVAYFNDGSRNFVFHVRGEASGYLTPEDVDIEKIKDTKWVQISGFTMSLNKGNADAIYKLVRELPADVKISFDPNLRPESLSVEQICELCAPVVERANLIFPSKGEAAMFNGTATDEVGCKKWASEGKIVVCKNGDQGSWVYAGDEVYKVPSFQVEEVDPTGAGDTFAGAFLTALVEGKNYTECARFANAAGAMSVRKQGPMEGAPSRAELEEFLKNN